MPYLNTGAYSGKFRSNLTEKTRDRKEQYKRNSVASNILQNVENSRRKSLMEEPSYHANLNNFGCHLTSKDKVLQKRKLATEQNLLSSNLQKTAKDRKKHVTFKELALAVQFQNSIKNNPENKKILSDIIETETKRLYESKKKATLSKNHNNFASQKFGIHAHDHYTPNAHNFYKRVSVSYNSAVMTKQLSDMTDTKSESVSASANSKEFTKTKNEVRRLTKNLTLPSSNTSLLHKTILRSVNNEKRKGLKKMPKRNQSMFVESLSEKVELEPRPRRSSVQIKLNSLKEEVLSTDPKSPKLRTTKKTIAERLELSPKYRSFYPEIAKTDLYQGLRLTSEEIKQQLETYEDVSFLDAKSRPRKKNGSDFSDEINYFSNVEDHRPWYRKLTVFVFVIIVIFLFYFIHTYFGKEPDH